MEAADIRTVDRFKRDRLYWTDLPLGRARTKTTPSFSALGRQKNYPVMLKHALKATDTGDLPAELKGSGGGKNEWDKQGMLRVQGSLSEGTTKSWCFARS